MEEGSSRGWEKNALEVSTKLMSAELRGKKIVSVIVNLAQTTI